MPLITIVTATLNCEASIRRTGDSLAEQANDSFEWIVVDGESKDSTLDVLGDFRGIIGRVLRGRDEGIYDAWNKAVEAARGEWIGFLGAGDTYERTALNDYTSVICEREASGRGNIDYISSRVRLTDGTRDLRILGAPWDWKRFCRWMCVAHVGSLHNRRLFAGGRRFDKRYRICGDYEFLLRFGSSLRAEFLDGITASMMTGGVSSTIVEACREAERAKVSTRAQGALAARTQRIWATGSGLVRSVVWY